MPENLFLVTELVRFIWPINGHSLGFWLTGLKTGAPTCTQPYVGIVGTVSRGLLKSQVFDWRPRSLHAHCFPTQKQVQVSNWQLYLINAIVKTLTAWPSYVRSIIHQLDSNRSTSEIMHRHRWNHHEELFTHEELLAWSAHLYLFGQLLEPSP